MVFLDRYFMIPLVLVCTCQFASACQSSVSDEKSVQQESGTSPVPVSATVKEEKADPVPASSTVKKEKAEAVWRGSVREEDPLDSAADIYSESPSNPAGIYEYQGLVFCIVEVPLENDHVDKLYYQKYGMLGVKEMLRKKYQLPSEFQLRGRVLENRKDDDFVHFRYAMVYRLKDIQALQKR